MSVNVQGKAQSQAQATQGFQQPQQQAAVAGFTPQFGITSRMSSFGSGGEVFEKLFSKVAEKVKALNEDLKTEEKYTVVKLLKQNYGLNYSGIVICETAGEHTAAHILMVEKTGEYPDKLVENISGVRYEIIRTPGEALDKKYVTSAQIAVSEALKVDIGTVAIVDGTLVPNEFDVTSDTLVMDLINNAFNAVHSETEILVSGYTGMNLAQLLSANPNGKFFMNMYFNTEESTFFDQTGLPVRQDVCLSLVYKPNTGNSNKSINQGNDVYDVVKTYGYVDFEYTGPTITNGMMGTQKFVPNFIITHIDSAVAPTPDVMMLGVASVFALNEDLNWMQAFRVTPGKKNEIDFNDIGGLNVEGNIENNPIGFGKKYDTKSKTFTIGELNKLIQTLVRPHLQVSIDLPKAGPTTWFMSVFTDIKFKNNKGAYDRVSNAITAMTNGVFQANNVQMFSSLSNKIHGGFYKTKDGFKDIRHLSSYLAVANYISDTNQQPVLISQYTNTLYNSSIPTDLRAAERKKTIDEMSNKSAVYKQYYDRVTFSAGFLQSVVASLRAVGFEPLFSNMGAVNDMFVRRSSMDFSSSMLSGDVRLMGQNTSYGNFFVPQTSYYRTW